MNQEYLKSLFIYNPETGLFTWRVSRTKSVKIGQVAGSFDKNGYVIIKIDGKAFKAHRLAWLYMTGKFPENMIDHKDENKSNNKFINLRDVDRTVNAENIKSVKSNNKSGFRGVSHVARINRWQANIRVNKKLLYLGIFATPELASAAYQKAKRKFHNMGEGI